MKKTLTFLLLAIMLLTLCCSCNNKTVDKNKTGTEEIVQDGFHYIILEDETAEIVKYDVHDYQEELEIPDKFGDHNVTVIGESAFEGSDRLQQVKFPSHITKIEKRAFYGSSIRIALMTSCRELISIGDEAFADCEKLVQVDISSAVTEFGVNAFGNSAALRVLTFRGNPDSLNENAFSGMNEKVKVWTYEENENVIKFFEDAGYSVSILPRS